VDALSKRVTDICVVLITAAIIWAAGTITLAASDIDVMQRDVTEIRDTLKGQETRIRAAELAIARMEGLSPREG